MPNAQEYVEKNYPNKNIKELGISLHNLTGSLDLSAYQQLEELWCWNNQLTNLDLSNCPRLRIIHFSTNKLTDLNFLTNLPHPEKITNLQLHDNSVNQTLDFLTPFVGLKELVLGTHFEKNITNFHGSLAPLRNCQRLKKIWISYTSLDNDIELLPTNLEIIHAKNMPKIEYRLKGYKIDKHGLYDYQSWRKDNQHLINLICCTNILNITRQKEMSSTRNRVVLNTIIFNLEQELIDIKKQQNHQYQLQQEQNPKQNDNFSIY